MYAPYDAEIDFLQDQISVLSDEIAERDKHIESLKSERVAGGYEAAGTTGRGGSRASSMAASEDGGGADRDVELQVRALLHIRILSPSLLPLPPTPNTLCPTPLLHTRVLPPPPKRPPPTHPLNHPSQPPTPFFPRPPPSTLAPQPPPSPG